MEKRMDRYKYKSNKIPTRSERNKELYKQIYDDDDFENLIVPSNEKAIDIKDLKKELTSRGEYHNLKEYHNAVSDSNNQIIRKEIIKEKQKEENDIYDIKELLNKAIIEKQDEKECKPTLTDERYLEKLNLDTPKTNMEQLKEIYSEIEEETKEEDESLLKTANLSLDILSDLKSDDDKTKVTPPIKEEELPNNEEENDFYSSKYKFSKKDFENKHIEKNIDYDYNEDDSKNKNFFFKIMLLIFGISLIVIVVVYLFNYFNRVSS